MKNILITGASGFNNHDLMLVGNLGFNVFFLKDEKDIPSIPLKDIHCVVCNDLFVHHDITRFEKLQLIQLTSSGLDRIPIDYVRNKGIKLYNARGVYSTPMAEFALSGILDLLKNKKHFYLNQVNHQWIKNRDLKELAYKDCLIIGCGSVGQEMAKLLSAFSCRVDGVDLSKGSSNLFEKIYSIDELDSVLNDYDIIVLALPLTESTYHIFNKSRFALLRENAIFVNISRGKVVSEEDLIASIDRIGGAVLDVFEEEPLSDSSPLWDKGNVLISPHNSFVGENNKKRLLRLVLNNLKECVK